VDAVYALILGGLYAVTIALVNALNRIGMRS
jgi:hypothetical protein